MHISEKRCKFAAGYKKKGKYDQEKETRKSGKIAKTWARIIESRKETFPDFLWNEEKCWRSISSSMMNLYHNDPSDHVIIAQAITMKMPLISDDNRFPEYRNEGLELIEN